MKETLLKNIIKTTIIYLLAIGLAFGIYQLQLRTEIVFLVFVVAILICLIETKIIYYSLVSSLLYVLTFNFLFTDPRFTFKVNDANYWVSFVIFILVCLIFGSIITKLQKQINISLTKERKMKILYEMNKYLEKEKDQNKIFNFVCSVLGRELKTEVSIIIGEEIYGTKIDVAKIKEQITYTLSNDVIIGRGETKFTDSNYLFFPLVSSYKKYGILLVNVGDSSLKKEEKEYIHNFLGLLITNLDKAYILNKDTKTKEQIAQDQFRTRLLNEVSKDLKVPLKAIQNNTLEILDNNALSSQEKDELTLKVYRETCDLTRFFENLLYISKLSKDIGFSKHIESVNEIFVEINHKMGKLLGNKNLIIKYAPVNSTVYCNKKLLIQVLINMVDNAIKYTKKNANIEISCQKTPRGMAFNVIDDGGGIAEDVIEDIFKDYENFISTGTRKNNNGLGIGVCKTIIEAHKGSMSVHNNERGGVTFNFEIPNQ